MNEREIAFESQGFRLAGTLCLPGEDGRFPVVLMIHGSGPLDRDENMSSQRLDVFNTIAHRLADAGVASVRYDKRGCGDSSGDYYSTGHADLVSDAVAGFDFVAESDFSLPGGLYLLGHSEGCIIAPQVFSRRREVAGLILVCPFVEDMESILLRQAKTIEREIKGAPGFGGLMQKLAARLMGLSVADQRRLIKRLRSTSEDVFRSKFQKVPAKALREMLSLDPRAIFRQVTCPMLLIGGEKDLQCDPGDVAAIAGLAQGSTDVHVVPDLTHVLRLDSDEPSMLRAGQLLKQPIAPVVFDLIEAWLTVKR